MTTYNIKILGELDEKEVYRIYRKLQELQPNKNDDVVIDPSHLTWIRPTGTLLFWRLLKKVHRICHSVRFTPESETHKIFPYFKRCGGFIGEYSNPSFEVSELEDYSNNKTLQALRCVNKKKFTMMSIEEYESTGIDKPYQEYIEEDAERFIECSSPKGTGLKLKRID